MNICKFLNKIFLVSAILLWASCSDDSSSNNPVNPQGKDSQSQDKQHPKDSTSAKARNKGEAKCSEVKIQREIMDENILNNPEEYAISVSETNARATIWEIVMEKIYPRAPKDSYVEKHSSRKYPHETSFCLFKMADTLMPQSHDARIDTVKYVTKGLVCDDGSSQLTEEYLAYEKELETYEKQDSFFVAKYIELRTNRIAELEAQFNSCVKHPNDFKPTDDEELREYNEALEEIFSSSTPAESSSSEKTAEAKSSSSSQKNNEGNFHGEFARVK